MQDLEKNTLREKIELRMQILETMMQKQMHIIDPITVNEFLDRVTYCWGVLNEEDRDYIQGCQTALEEKIEWK
jgi:hypothetical protein